jgi:Zn-dependent protease
MLPIPPLDGGQVLTNLLPQGPLSGMLERIAPFGLFIVLGLIVVPGLLSSLIGPPINALIGLIADAFGLPIG